jgi:hypothetical protein
MAHAAERRCMFEYTKRDISQCVVTDGSIIYSLVLKVLYHLQKLIQVNRRITFTKVMIISWNFLEHSMQFFNSQNTFEHCDWHMTKTMWHVFQYLGINNQWKSNTLRGRLNFSTSKQCVTRFSPLLFINPSLTSDTSQDHARRAICVCVQYRRQYGCY